MRRLAALAVLMTTSCLPVRTSEPVSAVKGDGDLPLSSDAMFSVLYEVQLRSANACRPDTGSAEQKAACQRKVSPNYRYRAESWAGGYDCADDATARAKIADMEKTKLGTIEDMLEPTTDYHMGVTLKYIKEKLGLNTVWVMPIFENNDKFNIPARCDNLGSPYAVRDYMHAAGSLSRVCIQQNKTEFNVTEDQPRCWGNVSFDALVAKANELGLRVMMDVALNHFGHNYRYYDYVDYTPMRDRLAQNGNVDALWDFNATFEQSLVQPQLLDTIEKVNSSNNQSVREARDAVRQRCPQLQGDPLVRAVNMWRGMMDWERNGFACDKPMYLEYQSPGFYAGTDGARNPHPSRNLGDNFSNNWVDVKFLYHHQSRGSDDRGPYFNTFVRNREYFFRILNYWVSRGVQGFRLDHATDGDSGMSPDEWKYLIRKVNHYDWVRKGRPRNHRKPIYMAEEFGDQQGMSHVVDSMTDGYLFNMRGGNPKDAAFVQNVLNNNSRFGGRMLVMTALETHDEHRLLEGTGFDRWTGAGFWGIGATVWAQPMILMGAEFGEPNGLSFKRSELLRSRFHGQSQHFDEGNELVDFYGKMIKARFDQRNRALVSNSFKYLPRRDNNGTDPRIFAMMKWWETDVMFVFHNLWKQGTVEQAFFIPPEAADAAGIRGGNRYKLVNAISNRQEGDCRTGDELKTNFYVKLEETERLQWLRLELCQ